MTNWTDSNQKLPPKDCLVLGAYREGENGYHIMECLHDGSQWCHVLGLLSVKPTHRKITHWTERPEMPIDYKTNMQRYIDMLADAKSMKQHFGAESACHFALLSHFPVIEQLLIDHAIRNESKSDAIAQAIAIAPFTNDRMVETITKSAEYIYDKKPKDEITEEEYEAMRQDVANLIGTPTVRAIEIAVEWIVFARTRLMRGISRIYIWGLRNL